MHPLIHSLITEGSTALAEKEVVYLEILLSRQAEKFLDKLNDKQAMIVLNAIQGLTEKPPKGDIRKLKGYVDEKRLRVGTIRVLFKIKKTTVFVSDIDFRGNIY